MAYDTCLFSYKKIYPSKGRWLVQIHKLKLKTIYNMGICTNLEIIIQYILWNINSQISKNEN